jgi:hypothetical protein
MTNPYKTCTTCIYDKNTECIKPIKLGSEQVVKLYRITGCKDWKSKQTDRRKGVV